MDTQTRLTGTKVSGTKSGTKIVAAILAALTAMGLTGCDRPAPTALREHLYVGLDMSSSVAGRQGAFTLLTEDLARPLVPGQDLLTLYSVSRRTESFYDQPVEGGTDGLEGAIVVQVQKSRRAADATRHGGTFPAAFWTEVAQRAAADPSQTTVVLFSDGDNDDMTPGAQAAIQGAARALANNAHVTGVAFYGVNSENMTPLRHTFAALGGRLHLYGPQEEDVRPFMASAAMGR